MLDGRNFDKHPQSGDTQGDFTIIAPEIAGALGQLVGQRDYWKKIAQHDQLTGLLNQETWKEKVNEFIAKDEPFGIILIDLNNFKRVNDKLLHSTGDSLLAQFSDVLRKAFTRRDDSMTHGSFDDTDQGPDAGRLGGDEFGIVFSLANNNHRGADPFERMDHEWQHFQLLADYFSSTLPRKISELGFGISFGGAVWRPDYPSSLDTLLRQADESMYESKTASKLV